MGIDPVVFISLLAEWFNNFFLGPPYYAVLFYFIPKAMGMDEEALIGLILGTIIVITDTLVYLGASFTDTVILGEWFNVITYSLIVSATKRRTLLTLSCVYVVCVYLAFKGSDILYNNLHTIGVIFVELTLLVLISGQKQISYLTGNKKPQQNFF